MNKTISDLQKYLKIYHICLIIFQIMFSICVTIGILILSSNSILATEDVAAVAIAATFIVTSILVSMGIHVAGIYFANKNTKFAYYFFLITSALGLTSILTLGPCIYFIIQLTKEEVKQYYGFVN